MALVSKKLQKDLKTRFLKAEVAVLGILAFIIIFAPLAIALSAVVGYSAYKLFQHKKKR